MKIPSFAVVQNWGFILVAFLKITRFPNNYIQRMNNSDAVLDYIGVILFRFVKFLWQEDRGCTDNGAVRVNVTEKVNIGTGYTIEAILQIAFRLWAMMYLCVK